MRFVVNAADVDRSLTIPSAGGYGQQGFQQGGYGGGGYGGQQSGYGGGYGGQQGGY